MGRFRGEGFDSSGSAEGRFRVLAACLLLPAALAFPASLPAADSPRLMHGASLERIEGPAHLPLEATARAHLAVALYPHGNVPADVRLAPVGITAAGGGITQVRFRHEVGGLPVFQGEHAAFYLPGGDLLALKTGRVPDPGLPGPFLLNAAEAVAAADAALAAGVASALGDLRISEAGNDWYRIEGGLLSAPARARRVVLAEGPTGAWRVEVSERNDPEHHWCVLVHGETGEVLETIDVTRHAATRGRVWPRGYPAGSEMVDFVDGEEVLHPASPAGWLYDDLTSGNNITVWEDRAGDGTGTPGYLAQGTGDPLTFDFPATGDPLDDLGAALTNVFWALNVAHDRFWRLGLEEVSGNFQQENFGRGGLGNDYTRVFVQYRAGPDATGIRNSNTAYAAGEGGYNSLTFGLWDRSGEVRDGALDTGLVYHEYAHLVIQRLVGGDPSCDDGTHPRALAEGWADYFAASFTGDRVIGAYVSGNPDQGLRTRPVGDNFYSLANFCAILGDYCNSERNGEIWSATLWDLRTALRQAYGDMEGAERADRLIVEGMRYTPCRPTFLQARDGLLLADLALAGGADHCLIWNVVRPRGMGLSAAAEGPDDPKPGFAFDVPGECLGGASLHWGRPRYGDDADARLVVADATAGADSRTVALSATSGDSEEVAAPGEGMMRVVEVQIRPGAPVPGDGHLQVVEGDTITALCADCAGAPEATAAVSRALDVSVNGYSLSSETCHDDDGEANVSDFRNELPGILDAGEGATLTVTLGNGENFPLEDVRVTVACDNPNVQVLPLGTIPVGGVRARRSGPWPIPLRLRAMVAPAPAVQFGDTATLTFQVEARGLSGQTQLLLPLVADYADERGLHAWGAPETFEPGSPTAALWAHYPADGQPADQWSIQDCGDGGGRAMVYAGPGCGDYEDTPSAATVVSPPLFDLSGGVQAIHPVSFTWRNEVDLGVDPQSLYCDSEMVQMWMTDSVDVIRYGAPRTYRNTASRYWVEWPRFLDQRNTTGWETATTRVPVTTSTLTAMDMEEIRLYWVFFTDVYGPGDGCNTSIPDAVGGGYRLDNIDFTYDAVRLAPAADTGCTIPCVARAWLTVSPPGGSRCAGDLVRLSGELSEGAACPGGALEYRFTGPGVDTGYTATPTADVLAAEAASWTLRVRCRDDTSCSDSMTLGDPTLDDSTAGMVKPGSLRATHDGVDVHLSWEGTRAPHAYALFRASIDRDDVAGRIQALEALAVDPPEDGLRHASPDALEYRDPGAVGSGNRLFFYRVFSRMPCEGGALDR